VREKNLARKKTYEAKSADSMAGQKKLYFHGSVQNGSELKAKQEGKRPSSGVMQKLRGLVN
jgi:hypothetical protein